MKALQLTVILLVACFAAWAQVGSLSGVIRDEQGASIQGAHIALVTNDHSSPPLTTTSDEHGGYQFRPVPAGAYHLEVSLDGFETRQSETVSVSSAVPDATMSLSISRHPTQPGSRPQFEAAGVRGLIDPGGYSAPANAAAASGLIKGIADIKRTGNDASTSVNTSCSLEPALQKAVADKPQSADAHLRLGEFYLAHGQTAKAIPMLERGRALRPGDQESLEQLAQAYLKAEQFETAKKLLVSAGPRTPEVHRLLARADEGLGKFTEAAQEYQLAASQEASEENLFGVGYEDILAGSPKDAGRAFEAGVQRYPQSMQLLIGLGSTQFLEGHASESIQTLLRAVALNPADPRPYPSLSQASSVSSEDAQRVRGAFEHYLSVAPKDPRAGYYLALNLLREPAANDGRIEELFQHSIQLDPDLADAHYQLGVLYARRGDYQQAARELETTVRLAPGRKEAHYRLAIAYRQTGRQELSAKEMQLFREAQEPEKVGKGANIDQYISVLETPSHETLCPGDSP